MLINGTAEQKDYYEVIKELNAKLITEEAKRNNLATENQHLKLKIDEMNEVIKDLQKNYKKQVTNEQINLSYESFFETLHEIMQRRGVGER